MIETGPWMQAQVFRCPLLLLVSRKLVKNEDRKCLEIRFSEAGRLPLLSLVPSVASVPI